MTHILLNTLAAILVIVGLAGAVLPMLPGLPMIFGGLWIVAATDGFMHVGRGWLIAIGCIGAVGLALDFGAAALGVKRIGASTQAVSGALLGTVIGLFFGLPGLVLGPFVGALAGELISGRSLERSAQVGVATWLGLLIGTAMKLAASVLMVVLFAAAWWLNRPA